ncbi:transcriptional regulator, TraR/DksA family [Roseivivax lentus]|uniref:Transcriptional regulator, TraR/DksA family n=1 Tax=Roseivivax lentus TaxID=633194 RepID=A0A1N7L0I3_9RHOB|nr:TraR/DksA family transcriptional regulator [Roseivivax lentus]SIS67170.1 transcriptional regulator, TraR/DksA family [Roseivivax lentus]
MTQTGQHDWAPQIERLQTWRAELLARTTQIDRELDRVLDRDMEDQAIQTEHRDVAEKLGAVGLREIRAIDAALERIKAGEYGICRVCGGDISPERLLAVPTTTECRDCAQSHAAKARNMASRGH